MNILALDTGTLTGWAVSYEDSPNEIEYGTHDYGGLDRAAAWEQFRKDVCFDIKLMPDSKRLIAYEKTIHRGAGSVKLTGFICFAEYAAWQMSAQIMHFHNASIKKYATGNGHASKNDMIQAAVNKGWSPANEHEADALWLLDYTRHQLAKVGK